MNTRVDLHLHTTASDGRWTPGELFAEVAKAGIELFSITDHDSLGALSEAAGLVGGSGLSFLPGVELSSRLNGQAYHLLAYGMDASEPGLVAFVEESNASLLRASDEAVALLAEAGYPVSLEEYDGYSWDRKRGGWKALNYLIDVGICSDVHGYFDELFGRELEHPEARFPEPREVIEVAENAGGVVVLAHPGAPFYNGLDSDTLDGLVEMGLRGLECYSFHHDQANTREFVGYCQSRDLLITGGSDYHGGFAHRALGVPKVFMGNLRLGDLLERVVV